MRFFIKLHMPESTWIEKDIIREIVQWKKDMRNAGHYVFGNPLKPPGMTSSIVRNETGELEVVEAPVEEKSIIFYAFEILECESMEEAVELAKRHPALKFDQASMEVREIWDSLDLDVLGQEHPDHS
tara:strand:+ start:154 stop:534 length:381 start_codon:yes stop_codon:yes gene_type:complete